MKKIVLNNCFGGFELSRKAYEFLGLPWDGFGHGHNISREDPRLVKCVETLGKEANGECAELVIAEYDDYNYACQIDDYDGLESLGLSPIVHKAKIETMNVNEIIEYLKSLHIRVVD